MDVARRVPQSAESLVHAKAQLLLQKAELTACLSALDSEITQLHSTINALKTQEATETAACADASARVLRLLDETEGCLTETVAELRKSSVRGVGSFEGLREALEGALQLAELRDALEKQHCAVHRTECCKCRQMIEGLRCPFCFSN